MMDVTAGKSKRNGKSMDMSHLLFSGWIFVGTLFSLSLSLSLAFLLYQFRMAKMAAEAVRPRAMPEPTWLSSSIASRMNTGRLRGSSVRACSSIDGKSKAYRELGLFSLKKKIEDAVLRAELMATSALELEEARRIKQEEMIRNYDLWDDPTKSNDILVKLADTARAVDALKDLAYKAEEAKLITQLAEMDAINYGLVEQAYSASLDVAKSLDQYEMLKLLKGPYDAEGASLEIKAGPGGMHNEHWAQELLNMYLKWAEKQGCRGRIIRKGGSKNGGISSATLEFEFGYAYGYLRGERGVHCMLRSSEKEVYTAAVDLIPLFLGTSLDLHIDEEDLIVLCPSSPEEELCGQSRVIIQHAPTGIIVESSGERSRFGNKMKALNRLRARLLVIASEQRVSNVTNIRREDIIDVWTSQVRRYVHHPFKLVKDVRTGIELPDLGSVLDGNIETLIGAHINMRHAHD